MVRRKIDARSAGAAAAKSGETGVRGALFLDAKGATTTRSITGLFAMGNVDCDACCCVRGLARGIAILALVVALVPVVGVVILRIAAVS